MKKVFIFSALTLFLASCAVTTTTTNNSANADEEKPITLSFGSKVGCNSKCTTGCNTTCSSYK